MKKQMENNIETKGNNHSENLKEVKGGDNSNSTAKIFTAAEMWNIQRRSVSMFQRRNCA